MTTNNYLIFGAGSGGLAVGFGAFGAHALKHMLSAQLLDVYHVATNYQMYHSLALILVAVLLSQHTSAKALKWSARFFLLGIILFSGSLYLLALTGVRWLGIITPIGGVSFILGWLMLTYFAISYSDSQSVNQ
ncbi:MAG: DUF423 domain-containing protein [Endozoicomonas sp. (ex Botrylloides leachii)]|nr:DUF423 domain-containing protein [Endozoicomonas sp. (ex Botrylloides leachii)]